MQEQVSGIVLAGGRSRRMGQDKAFLPLGGESMIQVVIRRLRSVAAEVVIVANDRERYSGLGDRVVADRFPGVGALGGIHSGLWAAAHDLALVVGCDMPFIDPLLLGWFVEQAREADVVILQQDGLVEPLHAAYRRTCLPAIEAAIRAGERRIVSFFPHVCVKCITSEQVARLTSDLRSFRNVNTVEEWQAAQQDLRHG